MEEQKYYIVCTKQMRQDEQIFLLWGPDFRGYTTDADEAGQYTAEEVRKECGDNIPILDRHIWHMYEKEQGDFLIPANDAEALKKLGLRKVAVVTYI